MAARFPRFIDRKQSRGHKICSACDEASPCLGKCSPGQFCTMLHQVSSVYHRIGFNGRK